MAVTTTTRFGVTRWSAGGDPFTRAQMDASHAAMESKGAMYARGTIAARPAAAAANVGMLYEATDQGGTLYWSTGAAWLPVAAPPLVPFPGAYILRPNHVIGLADNIASTAAQTLYTCPAGKRALVLAFGMRANTVAAVGMTLHACRAGAAAGTDTGVVSFGAVVDQNTFWRKPLPFPLVLGAGDVLRGVAATADSGDQQVEVIEFDTTASNLVDIYYAGAMTAGTAVYTVPAGSFLALQPSSPDSHGSGTANPPPHAGFVHSDTGSGMAAAAAGLVADPGTGGATAPTSFTEGAFLRTVDPLSGFGQTVSAAGSYGLAGPIGNDPGISSAVGTGIGPLFTLPAGAALRTSGGWNAGNGRLWIGGALVTDAA